MTPYIGARVLCPPDRGDKSYPAIVVHFTDEILTNLHGVRFTWVTVRRTDGTPGGVWPSHRLGFRH